MSYLNIREVIWRFSGDDFIWSTDTSVIVASEI